MEAIVTEVIAGGLYKALLYDRSPRFRFVEIPKNHHRLLVLKSGFLDNFETMEEKIQDKLLNLTYEKFADDNGQKELTAHMCYSEYENLYLHHIVVDLQTMKGLSEDDRSFLDNIRDNVRKIEKDKCSNSQKIPQFQDVLVQIFERFKDKKEIMNNFFSKNLLKNIGNLRDEKNGLLNVLNDFNDKRYENEDFIKETKQNIKKLALYYKLLNTVADKLDNKEFTKELITEIIEKISKAEGIEEQSIREFSSVGGLEKIIASMALLGCYDLHSGNIGVMKIGIEEEVYAKVDTSASFSNLQYTRGIQYMNDFRYMLLGSKVVKRCHLPWLTTIDYVKLKEKIDEVCDLFVKNPEYVESLVHRALFYKKPLLQKEEDLELVKDFAKKIIKQADLLKQFANSKEFGDLKEYIASDYDDYTNWKEKGKKFTSIFSISLKKDQPKGPDATIGKIANVIRDNYAKEAPSTPEINPQPKPQKPKSNSKYCYIGGGAAIGLLAVVGIAFAVSVTLWVLIAAAFAGAAFGALVGYCVSRCFDNPNVEEHKQLFVSL